LLLLIILAIFTLKLINSSLMKIGIIGFGYWGTNLVRNFANISGATLEAVADSRIEKADNLKKFSSTARFFRSADDILRDPGIDAVVIATPVYTHYEIALDALNHDKHVLIEKPMASTSEQATRLIELAEKKNKVLMVDHTYLYTGAVQKMKELVDNGHLGRLEYLDSTRINLGLFQPDINVLWDLAPHDLSILNYLVKEKPFSVQAAGVSHTKNSIENIAYLNVNFESGFNAHFSCSWTSPVKIRMLLLGGDRKMLVFNDLEPTEKLKIYDTGYEHKTTDEEKKQIMVDYRTGDIFIPKLSTQEALSSMAADFITSMKTGKKPVSDFNLGLNVLKVLEASQDSIKNKGREVEIKY